MNERLVSVIIPMYNAENYIEDCLESIISQTYRRLQIIIVNDGSKDQSLSICERIKNQDERIEIINKENGGVSQTRNYGIDAAKGDYIIFIDADDKIHNDVIEKSILELEKYEESILIQWNYILFKKDNYSETYISNLSNLNVNKIEKNILAAEIISGKDYYNNLGFYFRAVWGKVFITKIIKDNRLRFEENIYIGEDAIFLLNYMAHINNIVVIKGEGYKYRISNESAVRRYKPDLLEQYYRQKECIYDYLNKEIIIQSKLTKTALTIFCWVAYDKILQNDLMKYENYACKWYQSNQDIVCSTNIIFKYLSKFQKLRTILGCFLPYSMIEAMTRKKIEKRLD